MCRKQFIAGLKLAICAVALAGCSRSSTEPAASSADNEIAPKRAGIGVSLRVKDGKVFVNKVLPDTPAALSHSINANDEIVAIAEGDQEAVDVTGTEDVSKIVGMIRGLVGSAVHLTIVPAGADDTDQIIISLIRGDIKQIDQFVDGRLLPVGGEAPNFKFVSLHNAGEGELSHLRGRIVVVEFWNSGCGPCFKVLDELHSFREQHPEWAGQVELLALSVDDEKEAAVARVNQSDWSNLTAVWAGSDVLKLYRVGALPTVFVIGRDGKVVAADHRLDIVAIIEPLLDRSAE